MAVIPHHVFDTLRLFQYPLSGAFETRLVNYSGIAFAPQHSINELLRVAALEKI